MSERHRALPSWMKQEEKVKKKEPLRTRRKRKTARAAFYCMNERELVEAAVSYLTCEGAALQTHQQVEPQTVNCIKKREKPTTSQMRTKSVTETLGDESSDRGDDVQTTYVSETDSDITEVEPVPGTKSPQRPGSAGRRSQPVQDHGGLMSAVVEAGKRKEQSQMPADAAEEDDALRLVRDIFFS